MTRSRVAKKVYIYRMRKFLDVLSRSLFISLPITSLLLSVSLFLLHDDGSSNSFHMLLSNSDDQANSFKCEPLFAVFHTRKFKKFETPQLTSESLIIIRSVVLQQSFGKMYLKILLLKKCETNVSDLRLEVSTSSPPFHTRKFKKFETPQLTSESLIIIRSVVLQQSFGKMYLKILLLKKCETNVSDLRLELDHKHVLCPEITHIESDHCPWEWAIGCAWSSFIATAKLDFIPSHTLLRIDDRSIGLNLEPTHYIEKIHFAVCIQPLYWYIDWLQLFEFIEIWTSQGVTHFFFYIYSVSQVVMDLLQYYSDIRGIMTVIPWRSFPNGKQENPNESVYRLAHSLANNDCLLRTQGADFVAFVDLDEYILTSSKIPLIEYIKKKSAMCPKCGSFAILHRRMYYSSPRPQNNFELRDVNFNWLNGIKFGQAEVDGPHKQIVRPKTVSVISTHAVRENQPGYVDLNQSEIFLLHASYRWSKRMFPQTYAKLNLFGEIVPILKEKFYEVAKYIYKSNHSTTIDTVLQVKVATCIRRWQRKKCKLPITCQQDVDNKVLWIYADDLRDQYSFL